MACAIGPSVTMSPIPLQDLSNNTKGTSQFLLVELNGRHASVTTSWTDFSFQNLVLEFIWIFSGKNHYKINISHILNPNFYQVNSIKSWSSRSFQKHQRHIPFLCNFQQQFNLIFSEKIIQYSRTFAPQVQTSWNQADAPFLLKSFPKTPRTWFGASWFGGSHRYKTKQTNKQPCFIARCCKTRQV